MTATWWLRSFRHLLRWRRQPNIELRVIPYSKGANSALEGAFTLIESEQAPPVVQLENSRSTLFLHQVGGCEQASLVRGWFRSQPPLRGARA